jgi:hypothetical protein
MGGTTRPALPREQRPASLPFPLRALPVRTTGGDPISLDINEAHGVEGLRNIAAGSAGRQSRRTSSASPPDRRSSVMGANSRISASCSSLPADAKRGVSRRRRIDSDTLVSVVMSSVWCRIASELCCMCISRREMRAPMSSLTWGESEGERAWEADIVVVCACGAHGKVSCSQYLHYGTGPHTTGSRRELGCRWVLENEAVLHGQQRSDPPSMGAEGQSHSPPGRSTSPPHCPTDPWTRAHTAPPTCRLRVRGPRPRNVAHARRDCPRGNRTPPLSPPWGAHSGMRAMARGAEWADPRGSCHQPR